MFHFLSAEERNKEASAKKGTGRSVSRFILLLLYENWESFPSRVQKNPCLDLKARNRYLWVSYVIKSENQ